MSEMSNRINESGVRVRLIRPMRRLVAIGMKYAVRADRSAQGYGFAHGFTKYSTPPQCPERGRGAGTGDRDTGDRSQMRHSTRDDAYICALALCNDVTPQDSCARRSERNIRMGKGMHVTLSLTRYRLWRSAISDRAMSDDPVCSCVHCTRISISKRGAVTGIRDGQLYVRINWLIQTVSNGLSLCGAGPALARGGGGSPSPGL